MVDMAEVELMDDENEIREFNPLLLSVSIYKVKA